MTNGDGVRRTWGGVDPELALLDDDGRPDPPTGLGEAETILGFLDYLRGAIDWKTRDLGPEQLEATLPPSSMTLGGLFTHLAFVEDFWCTYGLRGEPVPTGATPEQWAADPDLDWHAARGRDRTALRAEWLGAVDRSRRSVAEVIAGADGEDPLGTPVHHNVHGDDPAPTLRWVLVHMVEEYARHAGHADLLREAVDGDTGE
ncbi:MAG: DinB family protein [Actinomycetaceae bacterium]